MEPEVRNGTQTIWSRVQARSGELGSGARSERGQAARDLDLHENQLRKWVKEFASDPSPATGLSGASNQLERPPSAYPSTNRTMLLLSVGQMSDHKTRVSCSTPCRPLRARGIEPCIRRAAAAKSHMITTRRYTANDIGSRTSSPSSRTGAVLLRATTDVLTPSSQQSASLQP